MPTVATTISVLGLEVGAGGMTPGVGGVGACRPLSADGAGVRDAAWPAGAVAPVALAAAPAGWPDCLPPTGADPAALWDPDAAGAANVPPTGPADAEGSGADPPLAAAGEAAAGDRPELDDSWWP